MEEEVTKLPLSLEQELIRQLYSSFPAGTVAQGVVGLLPWLSPAEMGTGWEFDGNCINAVLDLPITHRNRVVKQLSLGMVVPRSALVDLGVFECQGIFLEGSYLSCMRL